MPPFDPPGLTEAASRRQSWGSFAVFLTSLVVLLLPDGGQQAIASSLRASLLRPFLAVQHTLVQARLRSQEVEGLQAELDSLSLALLARATLEDENDRLRGLLDIGVALAPEYRPATAIRPGTPGSESMFILDVGSEGGISPRAPVLTREGLAGVVREVRDGTAIGMDWTHPDFTASAMTADGLVFGLAESVRGEFREGDRLILVDTPHSAELEPGTVILTSGLGGVYPRGIPVGRVESLAEAEGGWRKSYWLEPFVEVGSITHVLVAVGEPATRVADVSPAFPTAEVGTLADHRRHEEARADSLNDLTEEVVRLRARLDSLREPPDGSTDGGGAS